MTVMNQLAAAHADVVALHALDSELPGFEATNERVRLVVESAYTLPAITVGQKRKMARLILEYDGEDLEPAVAIALRSIADESSEPKKKRKKGIESNLLKTFKVSDGRPIGEVRLSELTSLAEKAEARAQQARAAMTILRPQSTQLA